LEVKDTDSYHAASELINTCQRFLKAVESESNEICKPFSEFVKQVKTARDSGFGPLLQAKISLSKKATDYYNEQQRKKAEEERKLAEQRAEAVRLQQENIKKMEENAVVNPEAHEEAGRDFKAAVDLETEMAHQRSDVIVKVKGFRTVKEVIIDTVYLKLAPVWALEYNEAAIKKAALAGTLEGEEWLKFRIVEKLTATGR
jgi:hypothetical protein